MTSPSAPSALNSKANSKDFTAHSPTSHPHPEGTAVVVNAAFTPWSNDEGVAPLPSPSSSSLSGPTLTALIAGIGLGGLFVLIAVGICFCFYRRRKKPEIQLPTTTTTTTTDAGGNKNPSTEHWHLNVHPPSDNMAASLNKPTVPPRTAHDLQSEMMPSSTQPIPYSTSCSLGLEKKTPGQSSDISLSDSTFTYQELAMATDNFSPVKLLGQGGFGYVHKGVLPTGKEIAVKQLKAGSCQGEREFQAEVETISRVHHRHLVPLVGYCVCGDQRLLVYEFVSNGTLELHLHGNGRPPMSWEARLKIAVGAAKGLAYLHEDCKPKIIHRDIKASNILIDDNFEAKVADFGLAKFCYDNDTHISTRVMGTFGYLAPEYASSGKLTEKSDIFSFGVLLLELITGRRPIDKAASFMDDSLVEWARPLLARALELRVYDDLVDPKLTEYNDSEMAQMIACAVVCVRNSARRRPRMSQIVRALEGNLSIDDLCKETSLDRSTICGSSDFDSGQTNKEELMKFRKTVFESGELSTSEFSAVASEYGVQASTSSSLSHDIESGKRIKEDEDVREILISGV